MYEIFKDSCLRLFRLRYLFLPSSVPTPAKGSLQIKKCHKKWKKFTIFLTPPPLGCFGLFWIWEKFGIWWDPPPLWPNWEKIEIGKRDYWKCHQSQKIQNKSSHGQVRQLKEASKLKNVTIFLTPPPSPRMFWTFLNLEKNRNLRTHPLRPNLGKFWNWENLEFWEPSHRKKYKLKTLKIA